MSKYVKLNSAIPIIVNLLICVAIFLATVVAATVKHVADYGAFPNDGLNDTSQIQSAINAASNGDIVIFSAGIYRLNRTLIGKSGIRLQGQQAANLAPGGKTVLRYFGNTAQEKCILLINDVSRFSIRDITLDGRSNNAIAYGINGHEGIGRNQISRVHIKNLSGRDNYGSGPFGILLSDQPNSAITSSKFTTIIGSNDNKVGAGIGLYGGPYTVKHNFIDTVGRNGIFALRCSGEFSFNTITNSSVTGASNTGISIELHNGDNEGDCTNVLVEHNNVDSWISVVHAQNSAIRFNTIHNNYGTKRYAGIEVSGSDIVVSFNHIYGEIFDGIIVERPSKRILVRENTVNGAKEVALRVIGGDSVGSSETLKLVNIADNKLINTKNYPDVTRHPGTGLEIFGYATNIRLDTNTISNNATHGIMLTLGNDSQTPNSPDKLEIIFNSIKNNGDASIIDDDASSYQGDYLQWEGNSMSGNHSNNIFLSTAGAGSQAPFVNIIAPSPLFIGEAVFLQANISDNNSTHQILWDLGTGLPQKTATVSWIANYTDKVAVTVWDPQGYSGYARYSAIKGQSHGDCPL